MKKTVRILALCLVALLLLPLAAQAECQHDFRKVIKAKYLVQEATCTTPAIYWYSCIYCGLRDTETFEHGEALGHDWSEYTYARSGKHQKTCSRCGSVAMSHCEKAAAPMADGSVGEICLTCGHAFTGTDYARIPNTSSVVQLLARDPEIRTYGLKLADENACAAGEPFYAVGVVLARLGKAQAIKSPVTVTIETSTAKSTRVVRFGNGKNTPVDSVAADGTLTFTADTEGVYLLVK